MIKIIEPLSKVILFLVMLSCVFPLKYDKRHTIRLTSLYLVGIVPLIWFINYLKSYTRLSYYVFVCFLFVSALVWSKLFLEGKSKGVIPYLLFYINCIICLNVFTTSVTSFFARGMLRDSLVIKLIFLCKCNLLFITIS